MIKYRLACHKGHQFEGWFDTIAGFEAQQKAQEIACPVCASTQVDRSIMAPAIPRKQNSVSTKAPSLDPQKIMHMMQKMTDHVTQNYEYVGDGFADEARKIYYGETENRDIYGETSLDEARDLVEEGVPIAPLPIVPDKVKN